VQHLCDDFATAITSFTRHSTDDKFSMRDRIMVEIKESKINEFNKHLGDCQRTISMVLVSINLWVLLLLLLSQLLFNMEQDHFCADCQRPPETR
jgi:hypothetical protein